MSTIRAVIVDPTVEGRLKINEVEPPRPAASEALVRISTIGRRWIRTADRNQSLWNFCSGRDAACRRTHSIKSIGKR